MCWVITVQPIQSFLTTAKEVHVLKRISFTFREGRKNWSDILSKENYITLGIWGFVVLVSTVAANQEPMLERDNKREREGYALAFEKSYKYFESIF